MAMTSTRLPMSVSSREGMRWTPVRIAGQVLDGAGSPIGDALVEIWQADASGSYPDEAAFADPEAFQGFGRSGTGSRQDACFAFDTIKPGGHDGEAPHLNVIVTMRGLAAARLHADLFRRTRRRERGRSGAGSGAGPSSGER